MDREKYLNLARDSWQTTFEHIDAIASASHYGTLEPEDEREWTQSAIVSLHAFVGAAYMAYATELRIEADYTDSHSLQGMMSAGSKRQWKALSPQFRKDIAAIDRAYSNLHTKHASAPWEANGQFLFCRRVFDGVTTSFLKTA